MIEHVHETEEFEESFEVTSLGREFVTVFMQNHEHKETPQLELLVTGTKPSTSVTITINKSDFRKEVKVGNGETISVPITENVEMSGTDTGPSSIVIKADFGVTVVSRSYKDGSGDTALLYPVRLWGVEYYIITPPWGADGAYAEFSVIGYESPTVINIYLKGAVSFQGQDYPKDSKLTLTLEPFQAIQIQSTDDLSGTKVVADHPVAVLSGHTCTEKNGDCGHVYEQLLPVASWGSSFLVPGMSFQPKFDIAFLMSAQDTCIEYQSGEKKENRNVVAGELMQLEVKTSSPLSIHANEKIQVLLYGTGGTFNDIPFNPFFTNIQSTERYGTAYELIGQDKFETNLAIIVSKTTAEAGITVDGKLPENIVWREFYGSEYSWAEYNFGSGFSYHTVQHLTVPFGLLSIGYSPSLSYGSMSPSIRGPGAPRKVTKEFEDVTSLGREFVTVFMQNHDNKETPQLELLVTGTKPSTSVSVTINKSDFRKDVKVGEGETVSIPITTNVEMSGADTSPSSLVIKSDVEVTIVSRSYKYGSGDTALLYPVRLWGVEYYIITPPWGADGAYPEFSVITHENPTVVKIDLKGAVSFQGKNYPKDSKLTLTLEPFQAVQIQSTDDLSGTKVVADHPVAVLSGHTCSQKNGDCGHVYEQLLPVPSWGYSFFVPGMSFQPKSDIVFIIPAKDTEINYQSGSEEEIKKLLAGEVLQLEVTTSSPLYINADSKLQVIFFGTGGTFNSKPFDPFLINIPATERFAIAYELIGQDKFETNLAVFVIKTSDKPRITVDGKLPEGIKWKEFPGSKYSWGEYNYGSGFSYHTVEHPTEPFGLLSIGYSPSISYGSVAPSIRGPGAPSTGIKKPKKPTAPGEKIGSE
ncbi:uncharacterized protein LOC128638763 [Bombina bombina]|uniref:uncharacterized protein LOC128638763 n=1 Tax=Bombina bombina TaxID=8345 RepID=UPI00235A7DEB|nr:uncharacterized protein LOC128638763 [Bombina bombina]